MSIEVLENVLRRASRLRRLSELMRLLLGGTAVLVVALVIAVAADVVLALPPWGLVTLGAALMGLAGAWLVILAATAWHHRFHPQRIAVLLERQAGIDDSRLINAVDLSLRPPVGGLSGPLCELSVRRGTEAAGQVRPSVVVDRPRLRAAMRWAALAVAGGVIAYVLVPGVFHAAIPRLVSPWADHPPYTPLRFEITIEPEPVVYGGQARIICRIDGPQRPHRATVVFVDEDGSRQQLPMMRTVGGSDDGDEARDDAFVLSLDGVRRTRSFHVDTPLGRSRNHELVVKPVPRFEHVELGYRYPAYTGWEPVVDELGPGGIEALEGTHIELRVRATLPLQHARLQLIPAGDDGDDASPRTIRLEADADDPHLAVGGFTLQRSGRFELALRGADGTAGHRTLAASVRAIADRRPRVRIDEPAPRVVVPEGWYIDVELSAEDDIGLDRLELHRSVNEWGPFASELPLELSDDGRRGRARYRFDLEALGAREGDVIVYFAMAWDNHPDGQMGESAMHAIQVVREEEYREFARRQYGIEELMAQWEAMLGELDELAREHAERQQQMQDLAEQIAALQERIEADPQAADPAAAKRLAELQQQLEEHEQRLRDLADRMRQRAEQPPIYDFEPGWQQHLAELADQLDARADTAAQTAAALDQAASQAQDGAMTVPGLEALMTAMEQFHQPAAPFAPEAAAQRQQTSEDLERIRLASEMTAQAARLRQIILDQRELTRRLGQFRHREQLSPAEQLRANELAEQQGALRRELEDAAAQLEALAEAAAEKLPRMSASAMGLCQAIGELDPMADQADAERLAAAGAGRYAVMAAELAAQKLESLLSDCDAMAGEGIPDLDGALALPREALQRGLQQLGDRLPGSGFGAMGGEGGGYAGSTAQVSVMGPGMPSAGASDAQRGGTGRAPQGRPGPGGHTTPGAQPATLTVDPTERPGGARGAVPGVPTLFQDKVEAYFRRLGDESR